MGGGKRLGVNIQKIKVMKCRVLAGQTVDSTKYRCGVWARSWNKFKPVVIELAGRS